MSMINAPKKNLSIADLPSNIQNKIRNRVKRSAGAHGRGVSHQWKNDYNIDKCKLRGPVGLLDVGDIVELRNVGKEGNLGKRLNVKCVVGMVSPSEAGAFTGKPHGELLMFCRDASDLEYMLVRTLAPTPNKYFKDLGWHLIDHDAVDGPLFPIFVIPKRLTNVDLFL